MTRDAIMTELLEIEGLLQDDRFHLNAALALRTGVSALDDGGRSRHDDSRQQMDDGDREKLYAESADRADLLRSLAAEPEAPGSDDR